MKLEQVAYKLTHSLIYYYEALLDVWIPSTLNWIKALDPQSIC